MPLNGRQFYSLAAFVPGVTPPVQNSTLSFRGGFNVAGSSEVANNFTLNGFNNNNQDVSAPVFRPSVDAIQEFRVLTGVYAAEFGYGLGGQIQVQIKSGTNQFHERHSSICVTPRWMPGTSPQFLHSHYAV
jgi:hypothetical protein